MNAEFVQSVASVGDYIEISLVSGNAYEGALEELSLNRLALRQPNGLPLAVALAMVVTVARKESTSVAPAGAIEPSFGGSPPNPCEPPVAAIPEEVKLGSLQMIQTAAEQIGPKGPSGARETVPKAPEPGTLEDSVAAIGCLPITLVDMGIEVLPEHKKQLSQISNSYAYAVRVNELQQQFGRTKNLYYRIRSLWNADRRNPGLNRLAGAMALLADDAVAAYDYLAFAAETGDAAATRLMAVCAARLGDHNLAENALLRFFQRTPPQSDSDAWQAMLGLLDAGAGRGRLGALLDSPNHDRQARAMLEAALDNVAPDRAPIPPGTQAVQESAPKPIKSTEVRTRPAQRHSPSTRSTGQRRGEPTDPYQRAKFMELQLKDLDQAKSCYRQAIKADVKPQSAVKDLAWLTRQTDGPLAALEVLEHEYAGIVPPGDALDNILIDFLTGARRYPEALEVLNRQYQRKDITASKKHHLFHQIAYIKLASGQDSTRDWKQLHEQSPDSTAVQRGLALALIQRGMPGDLDDAVKLIEQHTDQRAESIIMRIDGIRRGAEADGVSADWVEKMLASDAPGLGDATPPLVTYVMRNYSKLADQTRQRGTRATLRDLNVIAETARQMGSKQPENSAQAYISAAVLARELGAPDTERFLYSGLTTLADLMLDRKQHASARDLYCAALAAADEREDGGGAPDIRWALIGYLRSLSGRSAKQHSRRDHYGAALPLHVSELSRVLLEEIRQHGSKVLDLIPPVLADTSAARDLVLDAICSRSDLREATADHLGVGDPGTRLKSNERDIRAAWDDAVADWNRSRRLLAHGFTELRQVTISETTLDLALNRLKDPEFSAPEVVHEGLMAIARALVELRRFTHEPSFEERESCLRSAGHTARQVRDEVQRGPTVVAVELLEPIAIRIEDLIEEASKQLVLAQPPQPELSLALHESSGGQNGVVTVQIKVANSAGSAPLGSPELVISAEPGLFSVDEPKIQLPTAVRGNDHRIESVRLRVSDAAIRAGAFSLPVTLRYRFRSNVEYEEYGATLPVRLAREEEYEPINNPYQDGATGRPVESPNMFFGRDELINGIRSRLRNSSPGIGVAVFGQKRAGKSSIRLHLRQRLAHEDRLPVVDVGNIGDLSPHPDDSSGRRLLAMLMWRVLEGASRAYSALDEQGELGPLIPVGLDRQAYIETPEPIYDFAKILDDYRMRAVNGLPPLVVMIDEFQYFDQWIRAGLLSSSFMQSFKALLERRLFHLIIVGQAAVDRLIQADPNVFGVFSTERVTYLEKEDARQLIEVPIMINRNGKATTRYHERAVDQILELTGGSAFYIQRFCDRLVKYMNAERAPVVTEADVERVRDEFLDSLEMKDFENLESSGYTDVDTFTREDYQEILLAIARAARNQGAAVRSIRDDYHGPHQPNELLDDLVLRDVVRRDSGRYQIVVRLYQDWLLKYFGATSTAGQL
jgi:tetratricopeptide (TPR) repeat protein